MASSSRLVSDEELQKSRDDLDELLSRSTIDEEFRSYSDEEDNKKEEKDKTRKKKKKLSLYEPKTINALAQENEEEYGDYKTLVTVAGAFTKRYHDRIHAAQEKMRREVETKGCFTYEVTDDEEEDDNVGAPASRKQTGGRVRKLN
ncbi:hypothetical protein EJB05_26468 [Eragrostis curvula]|uniref:Uncharacterized protein n=1 Tax=Eragrostis curvula TaxID=38414 RepID=A0A5J9SV25_9POAL|nr:hypothetical protein EJB05_51709 [Eragrostis curvula]TVU24072.1 hypothetical protein EJB05_26468 [Eragrostis curvula]